MTKEEQKLADDRMRAEIAQLIAQASKLNAETAKISNAEFMREEITQLIAQTSKLNAETAKVSNTEFARAEIAELIAQTSKLNAETAKIARERFWIPFTVFASVMAVAVTVVVRFV